MLSPLFLAIKYTTNNYGHQHISSALPNCPRPCITVRYQYFPPPASLNSTKWYDAKRQFLAAL